MHASDCAVNNAPALPVGPCDCRAADVKKRTFEDPPLLNRSASNELLSCKAIAEMFRADAEKIHENWKAFEARRRVAELRKSCGAEPDKTSTINIRRPPRYQSKWPR